MTRPFANTDWLARGAQFAFLAFVLFLWDYVTINGIVSPIFLPGFRAVVLKFIQIVQGSTVWYHLLVTLSEVLGAIAIAATLGLTLGYLIGRSRYATTVF